MSDLQSAKQEPCRHLNCPPLLEGQFRKYLLLSVSTQPLPPPHLHTQIFPEKSSRVNTFSIALSSQWCFLGHLQGQPRHLGLDLDRLHCHLLSSPPPCPRPCSSWCSSFWLRFWSPTIGIYITLGFIIMITLRVNSLVMRKVRKQDRETLWIPGKSSSGAWLEKRGCQKEKLGPPVTYFTILQKGWHCHITHRTIPQSSYIIKLSHLSSDPLQCLLPEGDWFLNPESGVLVFGQATSGDSSFPGQLFSPSAACGFSPIPPRSSWAPHHAPIRS